MSRQSNLTIEKEQTLRALVETGARTQRQMARDLGLNVGSVAYHLKRLGLFENVPKNKGFTRKPFLSKVLSPELQDQATYYMDTKEIRLRPLTSHEGKGQKFGLIALVEKPSKLVALGVWIDELTSADTARVLAKSGLQGNNRVILADVGSEFTGEFEATAGRLGFRLCRALGWKAGRMSKPWVESIFGTFTNMFLHRIISLRDLGPRADENRLVKLNMFHSWVKEYVAYKTGQASLVPVLTPVLAIGN